MEKKINQTTKETKEDNKVQERSVPMYDTCTNATQTIHKNQMKSKNTKKNFRKGGQQEIGTTDDHIEKIHMWDVSYHRTINWLKQVLPDDLPKEEELLHICADQSITEEYEDILIECFGMNNEINVDTFAYHFLRRMDELFREKMMEIMSNF